MVVRQQARELTETVLGALVESADPDRRLACRGRLWRLPLTPAQVARLLPPHAMLPAARSWLRARMRNATAEITGGGREERSHGDWVERRMGGPAWHHLYKPYALRRWCLDSEKLSVSVARVYHGRPCPGPFQVVGGGFHVALDNAVELITAGGGAIHTDQQVERLVVEGGQVTAVETKSGSRFEIAGPLWVAEPASRVAGWLSDLPSATRVAAGDLQAGQRVVVALKGTTHYLPEEIHVIDEDAPFWRVVVPYGIEETALFHSSTPPGAAPADDSALIARTRDAAERLGIGSFETAGACVERLVGWQPVWTHTAASSLRLVTLAWQELGIVGVGRAGFFSAIDPAEEIRLASLLRDDPAPDQMELHRAEIAPPVRQEDLGARITRFVER